MTSWPMYEPEDGVIQVRLPVSWDSKHCSENSLIVKCVVAGICHCRSTTCASENVDLNKTVGELHGMIVDDGEDLGGDVDRGAEYLGCGAIQRCCCGVAVDVWVLICHGRTVIY